MKKLQHILYIDDEAHIQEVAQMCLETVGGFQVTCTQNGAEALEQIETLMPDLVLVDVMMPGMDGYTVLKKIRENGKLDGIPVVFMTARVQDSEIGDYLQKGAAGVVPKPFDPMKISEQICEIWEKKNGRE